MLYYCHYHHDRRHRLSWRLRRAGGQGRELVEAVHGAGVSLHHDAVQR